METNQNQISSDLLERIQGHLRQFTPAELRVADFVTRDLTSAANVDIVTLARQSDCSEATVSRFCHSLGFKGYREFRMALAQAVWSDQNSAYSSPTTRSSSYNPLQERILHQIRDVTATIETGQLNAACDTILAAKRAYILGVGGSFVPAFELAHQLMKLGLFASAIGDGDTMMLNAVHLRREDVVVAFSVSGKTREVVASVSHAQGRGTPIITVTSAPADELSRCADFALQAPLPTQRHARHLLAGRTAHMLVVDLILDRISITLASQGQDKLREIQKTFQKVRSDS